MATPTKKPVQKLKKAVKVGTIKPLMYVRP